MDLNCGPLGSKDRHWQNDFHLLAFTITILCCRIFVEWAILTLVFMFFRLFNQQFYKNDLSSLLACGATIRTHNLLMNHCSYNHKTRAPPNDSTLQLIKG